MKKLKILSALVCAAAFCTSIVPVAAYAAQPATKPMVAMYRLYNPNSGEHFYTKNFGEKSNLVSLGWSFEGVGWFAPKEEGQDVYRLYNKNAGEHHYTLDAKEKDNLVRVGWTYEGVGWKSAPAKDGVPLYRQYNPNAFANNHNYTTSSSEKNHLISLGWKDEKIGWYGVSVGFPANKADNNGEVRPHEYTTEYGEHYISTYEDLVASGIHVGGDQSFEALEKYYPGLKRNSDLGL